MHLLHGTWDVGEEAVPQVQDADARQVSESVVGHVDEGVASQPQLLQSVHTGEAVVVQGLWGRVGGEGGRGFEGREEGRGKRQTVKSVVAVSVPFSLNGHLEKIQDSFAHAIFRAFPTRMVYLYYIACLRYTILVGNPRY